MLYQQLTDKLVLDLDISNIVSKFQETELEASERHVSNAQLLEISPRRLPLWHSFGDIKFGRNFYINFPTECNLVVSRLKDLQKTVIGDSYLVDTFKNATLVPPNVTLIRTSGNVAPHIDATRRYALSIGLVYTDAITYVSESKSMNDYKISGYGTYLMRPGDAYITDVKHVHWVNSESKQERFIITYHII